MKALFRLIVVAALLPGLSQALASPQDDARCIVERHFDQAALDDVRRVFKLAFVPVYFKPLAGRGVHVADENMFGELVPDEDIAPFVEGYLANMAASIARSLTPDQLAMLAGA